MTGILFANGQRRRMPRRQITLATDELAIDHFPGTSFFGGSMEPVTRIQGRTETGALTPIYKIAANRVYVYCPDMFLHADGARRIVWQQLITPSGLDSHTAAYDWLVGTLAGDAAVDEGIAA